MPNKPLPAQTVSPKKSVSPKKENLSGVFLGDSLYWNPLKLPNPHFCGIGTSGSGKTQTLKAIAHGLQSWLPVKIIIVDYHGDQELPGETCYPLNQQSPYGINPLVVDLDPKGGGPKLQAIAVAATLKRALMLGPNQEGLLIEILGDCYKAAGISQENEQSWREDPPTFEDIKHQLELRIKKECKESPKLKLKLAASFQYGIFSKQQPRLDLPLIRFDLTALAKAPGLCAIATEALLKQLMDSHRLLGASPNTLSTFILIDEAKEVKGSPSVQTIVRDGRKYGLGLGLMSQLPSDFSDDILANTATKIVLSVDSSEVKRTASKFRFGESIIAGLQPLEALIRLGNNANKIKIVPYYQRLGDT